MVEQEVRQPLSASEIINLIAQVDVDIENWRAIGRGPVPMMDSHHALGELRAYQLGLKVALGAVPSEEVILAGGNLSLPEITTSQLDMQAPEGSMNTQSWPPGQ